MLDIWLNTCTPGVGHILTGPVALEQTFIKLIVCIEKPHKHFKHQVQGQNNHHYNGLGARLESPCKVARM